MNEMSDNLSTRREIEQLREMLEEKDRHINDLTDTLTHFHVNYSTFWRINAHYIVFFCCVPG